MANTLPEPHERLDQVGREDVEAGLREAMGAGALSHGWIIAAPRGAGKATLAYRLARGLLAPSALEDPATLQMAADTRTAKLVAQKAHPDLFAAERQLNEKTLRYQTEITVETVRELTLFLNHTPAMGGFRVAIIDRADDLNRNAANALLKALEEPSAKTALFLLAEAPGRLLATIRSRCRRIDLRPAPDAEIAALVARETSLEGAQAARIVEAAQGRPGYALSLAAGEGAAAIALADEFLALGGGRGGGRGAAGPIAAALAGKAGDEKWAIFGETVTSRLAHAARAAARGEQAPAPLAGAAPDALLAAWEQLSELSARGDALNLDRGQLVSAMAHDLRAALGGS